MRGDLHRKRGGVRGRVIWRLGGALVAALGLAAGPLLAAEAGGSMAGMPGMSGGSSMPGISGGSSMPGMSNGAGSMPGMAPPNPLVAWLPWIVGVVFLFLLLWALLQARRGKKPAWMNRQVVWGTLLIVLAYAGTAYAVKKLKKPGQMSVIEAQGMDMSVMKAPVGSMPVVTATAEKGAFDATVSYTGTVVAFNDEDVFPRVTGWIREMPVYPGDKVKAGQLVARLDTDELNSKVNEAAFARLSAEQTRAERTAEEAQARAAETQAEAEQSFARSGVERAQKELIAARSTVDEMQRSLVAAQAFVRQSDKDLAGARSAVQAARSGVDAAKEQQSQAEANLANARAELEDANAGLAAAQANVARWRPQLKRSEDLYKSGAISLEELQIDQASAKTAEAAVAAAQAKVSRARSGVSSAGAAIRQAQAMVGAAQAKVDEMQNGVEAAQARLDQAHANADAIRAKVAQAQATAAAAQANVGQMQADLDKSRASVRSAAAGVDAAARRKLSAGAAAGQMQAALTTAAVVKGYTEIRSSSPGVVTQRLVSPGVLVNPGTAILRIAQIDRVRLQAYVSEEDVAGIRVGNPVRVTSAKNPGQAVETKVTSIFPAADPTARTVVVEALTPNPGNRFVPGQYITMEISAAHLDDAVTVPSDALVDAAPAQSGVFYSEKQKAVWVVKTRANTGKTEYYCTMHPEVVQDHPGNCPKCLMKLEPRTKGGQEYAHQVIVTTGPSGGKRTVILSGLQGGEEVVVTGNQNLHEGDSVTPQGAAPAAPAASADTNMPAGMQMPASTSAAGTGANMPAGSGGKAMPGMAPAGSQPRSPHGPVYTCPMHPDVISDKPGQCPKCGMRLEKKG